jgi:hypothetical protein
VGLKLGWLLEQGKVLQSMQEAEMDWRVWGGEGGGWQGGRIKRIVSLSWNRRQRMKDFSE